MKFQKKGKAKSLLLQWSQELQLVRKFGYYQETSKARIKTNKNKAKPRAFNTGPDVFS